MLRPVYMMSYTGGDRQFFQFRNLIRKLYVTTRAT